jgi:ammonium transporter, Amt family
VTIVVVLLTFVERTINMMTDIRVLFDYVTIGYSFNCGSALLLPNAVNQGVVAGRAAANVTIAGSVGGITALLIKMYFSYRKEGETAYDISALMNGSMSGLVAVTAGCATIDPGGAVAIGVVSGLLYLGSSTLLIYLRIDDAIDGVPIHAVNGAWGVLATGLLSTPKALKQAYGSNDHVGFFYSMYHKGSMDATLLGNQIIGVIFICGFVVVTMVPFFLILQYFEWLRVDTEKEIIGLDATCMNAPEEDPADVFARVQDELRRHREAMESRTVEQAIAA